MKRHADDALPLFPLFAKRARPEPPEQELPAILALTDLLYHELCPRLGALGSYVLSLTCRQLRTTLARRLADPTVARVKVNSELVWRAARAGHIALFAALCEAGGTALQYESAKDAFFYICCLVDGAVRDGRLDLLPEIRDCFGAYLSARRYEWGKPEATLFPFRRIVDAASTAETVAVLQQEVSWLGGHRHGSPLGKYLMRSVFAQGRNTRLLDALLTSDVALARAFRYAFDVMLASTTRVTPVVRRMMDHIDLLPLCNGAVKPHVCLAATLRHTRAPFAGHVYDTIGRCVGDMQTWIALHASTPPTSRPLYSYGRIAQHPLVLDCIRVLRTAPHTLSPTFLGGALRVISPAVFGTLPRDVASFAAWHCAALTSKTVSAETWAALHQWMPIVYDAQLCTAAYRVVDAEASLAFLRAVPLACIAGDADIFVLLRIDPPGRSGPPLGDLAELRDDALHLLRHPVTAHLPARTELAEFIDNVSPINACYEWAVVIAQRVVAEFGAAAAGWRTREPGQRSLHDDWTAAVL